MVVGGRGRGKTYGAKKKAIQNYIGGKGKFAYVRRYQDELDIVKKGLFNDYNINHTTQITFDKGVYWKDRDLDNDIIGEEVGYPIALSTSHKLKSASFPDVNLIIFDEFIVDPDSNIHYLKNEIRKFLDLIETIGRMRDNVRVMLLANSLSVINPYTKAQNGLVLFHILQDDEEFIKAKESTKFGQLIKGTEYARMSISNEFICDSDTFVGERPKFCRYVMTVDFEGVAYAIWRVNGSDLLFVDTKVDNNFPLRYALTLSDHTTNTTLLGGNCFMVDYVLKRFMRGDVIFDSIRTKSAMVKILNLNAKIRR